PATSNAGSSFSVTVTALDAFNNTATGYGGIVKFTSSDTNASLPGNTTLTSGVGNFTVTLRTSTSQRITATDTVTSSITGTTNVVVSALAATHLAVSAPATATAGVSFVATVTAQDQFGNTDPTYGGTVHFTSSDTNSPVLPPNSMLTNGTATFTVT